MYMYQHSRLKTNRLGFFQKFRNFDYILLFCIIILGFVSLVTMYSTDGGQVLFHTKSHFTKLIVFTIMMLVISFINIKYWFALGYLSYLVVIGLLVGTYLFGITSSGSQRWINLYFINLQPSELMKVFIILCLAKYFHRMKLENVNSIYTILSSLIIIMLPMGLVIVQPDLGTSLLIGISGIAVLWFAGVNHKYFIYTMLGFVISQSYLEFLPEKHTDFIFTLFSEEFGFVGSAILLIIYAIIIYRIVAIGASCRSYFAKIFCYSFGAAIFVFITINMSMVLGLLPIVGSPLPIMSYGGSSMLATMIGFGIVMSARVHNQQLIA